MTSVATHCPYCALQCGMALTPVADRAPGGQSGDGPAGDGEPNRSLPIVAGRAFPTNRGGLCRKGWTSATVLGVPDRLTRPLLRGPDGALGAVSWPVALDHIAERLQALITESGPQSVAVFGGGGLTNEKAYQLGKFARIVLRTPNIDYNGRFCMSSAAAAANRSLGIDRGLPFPLADLGTADAILLLGSNIAETMPPAVAHLAGVRDRGGLIVVDPRRSATAALGSAGQGLHLQPVPGTDLVVLSALLHVLFAEGLVDHEYLAARTTGADEVLRSVSAWWPERAESVCGVAASVLRGTARRLAAASPSRGGAGVFVLSGRGVEQSSQGTDTVTAAISLALALGLPGRRGSGYGAITGQGNGQGGREHGQKADQLPGYRSISDPAARRFVAGVWGVPEESLPGPGLPAVQLLSALGRPGGPRALLVHGSNPVVSAPDADRVVERLRSLDLLVVCDVVPSETALLADVVLPVTQWAEEEGTMTSLEGRVLRRRRAVDPPPEVRSELWILAELSRRLGGPVLDTDPAAVFDDLARASAGGRADYSGLSHARLDEDEHSGGDGLFWPCPAVGADRHPGSPRLFANSFPTPDGRARLVAVEHRGPADDLRPDAPVYLVTGRILQHYQSGAQTRRVPELNRSADGAFVEIHPLLADRFGIEDGDRVRLRSARGTVVAPARFTERIRPDTVFMPFHFAGAGSVNRITNDATDPISGMPEFKVCAVSVEAAASSDQDAGALRTGSPAPVPA
ncbi:molybdopterin oxidoreductase family protein [Nakamurella sp. A5-74]|uniref:Molybdopterin oxidoreductase family protein n=1 Tax=Nakamurella sp. A5-74 TaxID=3158264 RepID=A0AAU8DU68_9ACTN